MEFLPPRLLQNRHVQTVLGTAIRFGLREPPTETVRVELPDGDQLALEVSTPDGWSTSDATAVLVHGLTGSHQSPYMIRTAAKLHDRGVRVVRVNLRGCGTGRGLARRPYHAGLSADLQVVLEDVSRWHVPRGPVTLIGWSMGGNIVLKLAGELGAEAGDLLDQVIAICPAADLHSCIRRIPRLYQQYFVLLMHKELRHRLKSFPDLERVRMSRRVPLKVWDDRYTAPQWEFDGVDDYYSQASAAPHVPRIRIPTRVLLAEDDPIIDPRVLDDLPIPDAVSVLKVGRGGHMGFLSGLRRPFWQDTLLLRWLGFDS